MKKEEMGEVIVPEGFNDEVPVFESTDGVPLGEKRFVTESNITIQE